MEKSRNKIHRAWWVLIATIAIQGGIIGILVNCTSIIFSAIIDDLGFRSGDLSIYYTIRFFAQAATVGITSKLFLEKKPKVVMTALAAIGSAAYIAMYFYSHIWQWYISGILVGICMSCVLVVIPVILNNWFKVKTGLIIGIAMAASGLSGAVFTPLISKIIVATGWRKASVITGIVAFFMIVIPTVLLLNITPEEIGMKPYGWEYINDGVEAKSVNLGKSYNVPKSMLILTTSSLIIACVMTQFGNQLPIFASSLKYPISVGATVASCSMVGNVLGKLLTGALADKIGIFPAVNFNSILIAVSMIVLMFSGSSPFVMYTGSVLYGLVFSMATTVPPLVYMSVYGATGYSKHLSKFQSFNSINMAISSSLLPYLYDFTGSFKAPLMLGLALTIISLVMFNILSIKSKKLKEIENAKNA